jgi:RNA polymerase subunit RPABC4/transcription elongation factor Spt4
MSPRVCEGCTCPVRPASEPCPICNGSGEMAGDIVVLDAKNREWLALIGREGTYRFGPRRQLPHPVWALKAQGLVFRSHFGLSLTAKGEDALAHSI